MAAAAGNLLNDGINRYTYDVANRLTSLVEGGTNHTTTMGYNGLGEGIRQTTEGVRTDYLLDLPLH